MQDLLKRLAVRPVVTVQLLVATFLVNLLALASPIFVIQVLNRYVTFGVDATLATLVTGALIAVALEFSFRQVRMRLAAGIVIKPDEAHAVTVFNVLTGAKTAALERVPSGIRRQAVGGADAVQSAYSAPNLMTVVDVPFALLFLGALFLLSPMLSAIASLFVVAMLLLCITGFVSLKRPTRELQQMSGQSNAIVSSAINAADTVRAFNATSFLRRAWQENVRRSQGLFRRVASLRGLMQSFNQSGVALMTIAIIGVGAVQVVNAELDVGALIGANILASRVLMTVSRFAFLGEAFAKAKQAVDLAREFARLPLELQEGSGPAEYQGRIVFKDMAFVYPGNNTPLFESVSLTLEPGAFLVVTGANGTGKTTLARLVVGLLDPARGHILVDGLDLRQVAPEWWRKQVCYMPQEPTLLNATIAENLRTVNPELDDAALNAAITAAGLRKFISESSDGFETRIENNGGDMALGIRRRLALARALTTGGRLVLFDEPTGGLDEEGCQAVYAVLNELSTAGRTVITCSHDPEILKAARAVLDLNHKPVPRILTTPTDATGTGADEVRAS